MIERRVFVAGSLAVLPAPFAAETQQGGRVYRLGMLSGGKVPGGPVSLISAGWDRTSAGLAALGYEEGRNIVLEARFADGKVDRLPALAAELVRLRVDLIFTRGTPATRAAKAATATIPILFNIGSNPVEKGLKPTTFELVINPQGREGPWPHDFSVGAGAGH